jgi:hypothetical protein
MTTPTASHRRKVQDLVSLALAHSEVKTWLGGAGGIKSALDMKLQAMTETPGTLALGPIWDLLKSQPGFVQDQAAPAFCKLKTWELQLGETVKLPAELEGLDPAAREYYANLCKVAQADLLVALDPSFAPAPPAPAAPPPPVAAPGRGNLLKGLVGTLAVSLVAAVVAVVTTPSDEVLAPADVSKEMPLSSATLAAPAVILTLSDKDWSKLPEDRRRRELASAMENARRFKADRLTVFDADGAVRAVVSVGDGDLVQVSLF